MNTMRPNPSLNANVPHAGAAPRRLTAFDPLRTVATTKAVIRVQRRMTRTGHRACDKLPAKLGDAAPRKLANVHSIEAI